MEFQEFKEVIRLEIEKIMGREAEILTNRVNKNNGVVLEGISIVKSGCNIFPNIYLNDYYNHYVQGKPLKTIVEEIVHTYDKHKIDSKINMDFFSDFEQVKGRIVCKVVNREKNTELLKEVPFLPFLDLAVVFYCLLKEEVFPNASILIKNQHCELWKKDVEALRQVAFENAMVLLPYEIKSMEEVMKEMFLENLRQEFTDSVRRMAECDIEIPAQDLCFDETAEQMLTSVMEENGAVPMYVLSNFSRIHGAVCMLYRDVLKQFSEQHGCDIYILPSSVHEVILIPAEGEMLPQLEDMVREVNETQLETEEVLSDNVYLYSAEQDKILLCEF